MNYLKTILILLVFVLSNTFALSQEVKELFKSDEILELEISLPLKTVINDLTERKEHMARVGYNDLNGDRKEFNIKVKVRGKTRAKKSICRFPPLELNFKKKQLENSVFAGQNKLKLVTHCKTNDSYEEYIKKEYSVYKLYQHVSPYSFKVRLCKINYIDTKSPEKSNVHVGFLIEDKKDVASRNDMKVFKQRIVNQEVLYKSDLDKLVMFEFLIGNLDWSIPNRHNVKLIKTEGKGLPIAVPYDFDYSGIVNVPYSVPPDGIDIPNVRTRVFWGLCREFGYRNTIDYYLRIRPQLEDELKNANYLSDRSRKEMTNYLQGFYQLIANPKNVENKIDKACRAKHQHIYDH